MCVRPFPLLVVCLLSAMTAGAQVVLENQTEVALA